MFTAAELAAFKARVRAAIDAEDLVTIGGMIGLRPKDVDANREKVLMVMHKHRLEMADKPRGVRQASFDWLRVRGHTDVMGSPLPARLDDLGNRPPHKRPAA